MVEDRLRGLKLRVPVPGVTDHEIEHEIASICGLAGGRR